jgi:hypothetical protein
MGMVKQCGAESNLPRVSATIYSTLFTPTHCVQSTRSMTRGPGQSRTAPLFSSPAEMRSSFEMERRMEQRRSCRSLEPGRSTAEKF